MAPTRGEYALLPVQVTSPGPPARHSSLTPRFRTSTSQASEHDDDDDDDDHVPSPPSPDDVPRVLRRTRPRWSLAPSWPRLSLFRRPSLLVLFLLIVVIILFGTATAAVLRWVHATWELHIMLDFYPRQWWAPSLEPPPPLSGCFSPGRLSPLYNVSERVFGPRHTDIHAGLSRLLLPPSSSSSSSGGDCYDFASTVKSREEEKEDTEPFLLHSFWPAGRAPFGPRQEAMLKSVLATQPRARSRLVLWSDRDISTDVLLRAYVERHGSSGGRRRIELRVVDLPLLAEGTELEDSALMRSPLSGGSSSVSNADADAELIRLLVLWRYGGVWVDMDSLLTRDLTPLLEHEFVTQWKCDYDTKNTPPMAGALMHFYQHSPYLCEAFHVLATSSSPLRSSADWGAQLYDNLWSRLIAEGWPPFKILPFCFSDGRSCGPQSQLLPDPLKPDGNGHGKGAWAAVAMAAAGFGFGTSGSPLPLPVELLEGGALDQRLQKVFAVHLRDRGKGEFPSRGWVQRLLIERYDRRLSA